MKNTHTGNLDRIKSIITLNGPQTVSQLVKATGISDHYVRTALDEPTFRPVMRSQFGWTYGLTGIHAPKAKEYPKPYVHPFTPLSRDPFAHRDLALMGR